MTQRRHNLLHAVKKSTREVMALVRESVLPWYKGEGREMGKTVFHDDSFHYKSTLRHSLSVGFQKP